jgi:hypothetical protein
LKVTEVIDERIRVSNKKCAVVDCHYSLWEEIRAGYKSMRKLEHNEVKSESGPEEDKLKTSDRNERQPECARRSVSVPDLT